MHALASHATSCTLRRVCQRPVVSEQALVKVGMMRQSRVFIANNYVQDPALIAELHQLQIQLYNKEIDYADFVAQKSALEASYTQTQDASTPTTRDRFRKFKEDGMDLAAIEVEKLMATPEYQEHVRKKRAVERHIW